MGIETEAKRADCLRTVRAASHVQLARLVRFSPVGSFYFTDPEVADELLGRFAYFGGMTPAVSKAIGWDR